MSTTTNYSEAELRGMSRSDLDDVAVSLGLNPSDYEKKGAEVQAILNAQGNAGTTVSTQKSGSGYQQEGPGDPMLTDPRGVIESNFAGTTSDPSTHVEGQDISEVERDPDTGIEKASDAEDYNFPQGGDVDIALVDAGSGEGEYFKLPDAETWVVLDGSSLEVPEALDGHRAAVLSVTVPEGLEEPVPWDQRGEVMVTVRTRDEYNATLYIPLSATKEGSSLAEPRR